MTNPISLTLLASSIVVFVGAIAAIELLPIALTLAVFAARCRS